MTDPAAAERWILTLYVNGGSPNSIRAMENVRRFCDEELAGRVELEIVDVRQQPALVVRDQVVAAPTLVKRHPGALRRIVGSLSDADRLALGLDLPSVEAGDRHPAGAGSEHG
jgi:circadian clock protein KaiB